LFALARVLPICDRIEVRLLGTGMPSVWIAHMGEMRLTLALSGWTANDWTSGANLELLVGNGTNAADGRAMSTIAARLAEAQRASADTLAAAASVSRADALASLHDLCKHGQAVYDFAADCYRWREVMPFALSEAVLGPEHPELTEGRRIARGGGVKLLREVALDKGRRLFVFKAGETSAEAIVDADGAFRGASCTCSFHFKNRLRAGPCRHLVALKLSPVFGAAPPAPVAAAAAPRRLDARKRGALRREDVVSFLPEVLTAAKARADAEDTGLSEVVEAAWDLAFERVQACASWKDAVKLVDPARAERLAGRSVADPVQQTVALHDEVLREIGLVAQRFGASPSAIVNLAWSVASGGPRRPPRR
jgi:hypothetical protein